MYNKCVYNFYVILYMYKATYRTCMYINYVVTRELHTYRHCSTCWCLLQTRGHLQSP